MQLLDIKFTELPESSKAETLPLGNCKGTIRKLLLHTFSPSVCGISQLPQSLHLHENVFESDDSIELSLLRGPMKQLYLACDFSDVLPRDHA